jgi:hypothetical protein
MRAAQFLAIIGRGSKGSNALENTEDRAGATSEQQDNVINTVNSLDPYGPSWQLVPGNVAAGTVYAQVPSSGTGDLTFTRASTATRTNSAGTIVNVATGVPRIDYRNADGSLSSTGRLLLEPQRTNLVPNGVLFNSTTGVSYDSSITASPAPGVQNATRITKNEAAGNVRYPNQNASATLLAGSSVYTLSRYFKYDGFDFQTTMEYNNAGNWGGVSWTVPINISATAITIGPPSACTATIVNTGSGWYRVTVTITTGVTIVGAPTYLMRLPSTLSTGQGFLTALPQFELGAYATTFIPTTTAAVTRLVDSFSRNNLFTNNIVTASGGTWFLEISENLQLQRDAGSTGIYLSTDSAGVTNSLSVRAPGGLNRLSVAKYVGGSLTSLYTTTTNKIKIAFKWNGSTVDIFVNGTKQVNASVFNSTELQFLNHANTGDIVKYIDDMALFPVPMTDAQCIEMTTL